MRVYRPNEDQTWRDVYSREYGAAEGRGLQSWQAREEASRTAWRDYEARTGQPALLRNAAMRPEGWARAEGRYGTSEQGKWHLVLSDPDDYGRSRLACGAKTMVKFPAAQEPGHGALCEKCAERGSRTLAHLRNGEPFGRRYGGDVPYVTRDGRRVWMHRKGQRVRWLDEAGEQVGPEQANVAPALAYAAAHGWAYRRIGHEPNASGYYVWVLARGSNAPLTEGPYGPYDTLGGAKTFARIGATEGAHDRAVSVGLDPNAPSFQIVRRYEAGTGERLL